MRLLRAVRYECFQMFFTKRWWGVPVVAVLLAVVTAQGQLGAYEQGGHMAQYHLAFNAWDVVVRSTQTWLFLLVPVAPLLVFIVGESYLRDRSSNAMSTTVPRVQSRSIWWTAKVLSMFIGASVYMALFSLISLLVAGCFYPFAWHFSSFQLHPELVRKALTMYGGDNVTLTIPEETPILFLFHLLLYSTLSFGAYALAALVLSLRVHKPGLPALLMFGMGLLEFYAGKSSLWPSLHSWVMQTRLSYLFVNQASTSFLIKGSPAYTLPTSILYYLVLSVLLWLIGDALVQHDDL
jgi:hypothetical protein